MMKYSSGKDNYLLLKGSTGKESSFFGPTYTTIPVFNMNSGNSFSTDWNSQSLGYDDFSDSTYSLILVPKDGEIRSKVDTKIDGEGTVTVSGLSNGTAKFGEKVEVNITAPENYWISSIKVQYHNDASNPTKATDEKVISTDINTNEFKFDYTVPCSNITILVETKEIPESLTMDNNDNYVISTYEDISVMAEMVNSGYSEYTNGSYVLTNDVTFPNEVEWTTPIGTEENPFRGTFDGQDHTIGKLSFDAHSTVKNMGLFGVIDGGTVKNLNLDMTTGSILNKHENVGSICGLIKNGTISDCNTSGFLCAYSEYFGGLVGTSNNSTIKNCTSELYVILSKRDSFGDFCGQNINTVIDGCTQNNDVQLY